MKKSLTAYLVDTYAQANNLSPYMLEFTYFPPEYRENKSAEYAYIDVMGRSEPFLGYRSSGQRQFSMNFRLGIDVLEMKSPTQPLQIASVDPTYGTLTTNGPLGPNSLSLPGYNPQATVNTLAQTTAAQLLQDKQNKLQFLQALTYPNYDDSGVSMILPPPTVLLIIGTSFFMQGVVLNVGLQHIAPYDYDSGISHYTDVDLTIGETAAKPYSYLDVRNGLLSQGTGPSQY